jgi:Lar family restriction alleviation protein
MSAVNFAGVTAKPCPFCGCADTMLYATKHSSADMYYVRCLAIDCYASGPLDLGRSGALAKWNNATRLQPNVTNWDFNNL